MPWQKPGEALVECFQASLPSDTRVERRKMFGCPCAFTGGNMFAGVHEQSLILRLPPERRETLLAARAAQPFIVMGRTMREYVAIAGASRNNAVRDLVAEAFAYAASLPPKTRARRAGRSDLRRG
jgi:TfoX/Sxy family transcriptional regulator of competence genes